MPELPPKNRGFPAYHLLDGFARGRGLNTARPAKGRKTKNMRLGGGGGVDPQHVEDQWWYWRSTWFLFFQIGLNFDCLGMVLICNDWHTFNFRRCCSFFTWKMVSGTKRIQKQLLFSGSSFFGDVFFFTPNIDLKASWLRKILRFPHLFFYQTRIFILK